MKKRLLSILALMLFFIIPSCVDTFKKDRIVIGDSNGMRIYNYDSLDFSYKSYDSCDYWFYVFDINKDDVADIELYSSVDHSIGDHDHYVSGITCLNEKTVLCCKKVICTEIIETVYEQNDTTNNIVRIHHTGNSYEPNQTDSIRGDYEILLLDLNKEQLCVDDFFYSYDQSFYDSGFTITDTETIQGIEYHKIDIYSQDCYDFNLDGEKLICFKLIDDDKERLGWIKFVMVPVEGYFLVKPLEIAVQE